MKRRFCLSHGDNVRAFTYFVDRFSPLVLIRFSPSATLAGSSLARVADQRPWRSHRKGLREESVKRKKVKGKRRGAVESTDGTIRLARSASRFRSVRYVKSTLSAIGGNDGCTGDDSHEEIPREWISANRKFTLERNCCYVYNGGRSSLCRSRLSHRRFASSLPGRRGRRSYDARCSSLGAPSFAAVSIRHRRRCTIDARVTLSFVSTDIGLRTTRSASKSSRAETSVPESYDTASVPRGAKFVALDASDGDAIRAVDARRSLAAYVRKYVRLSKKLSAFLVAFTDYERRIVVSLLSPPRSSLPIGPPPLFPFPAISSLFASFPTPGIRGRR